MSEESGRTGRRTVTAHRPDPRSPYVYDTRDFGRRPGTMRTVTRTVPAPASLGDNAGGTVVADGTELGVEVRLEAVVDGVLATGTVTGTLPGECVRCLDPLDVPLEVEFQELYLHPGEFTDDEDAMWLVDEQLDLEPVVHDAVVLDLPVQPLCRDDCPGLCAECGARLADDPDHRHESADPRWAALQRFRLEAAGAHDDEDQEK